MLNKCPQIYVVHTLKPQLSVQAEPNRTNPFQDITESDQKEANNYINVIDEEEDNDEIINAEQTNLMSDSVFFF